MFTDFLFHLRGHGIKVSLTEWLPLMRALAGGHARADLTVFYHLARALLVKTETLYDLYDRAFAEYFAGVDAQFDLSDELLEWLAERDVPSVVALTKCDKLKPMRRAARIKQLRAQLALPADRVIPTSSEKGLGIPDLWAAIDRHLR